VRWLTGQRILLAQELLEETTQTVDVIADRTGFGNAAALRHHFRAWRGTTPQAYRRAFSPDAIPAALDAPDAPEAPDVPEATPELSPAALGPSPVVYTPSTSLAAAYSAAYSSSGTKTVGMAG
jgi:hypothetical protein